MVTWDVAEATRPRSSRRPWPTSVDRSRGGWWTLTGAASLGSSSSLVLGLSPLFLSPCLLWSHPAAPHVLVPFSHLVHRVLSDSRSTESWSERPHLLLRKPGIKCPELSNEVQNAPRCRRVGSERTKLGGFCSACTLHGCPPQEWSDLWLIPAVHGDRDRMGYAESTRWNCQGQLMILLSVAASSAKVACS